MAKLVLEKDEIEFEKQMWELCKDFLHDFKDLMEVKVKIAVDMTQSFNEFCESHLFKPSELFLSINDVVFEIVEQTNESLGFILSTISKPISYYLGDYHRVLAGSIGYDILNSADIIKLGSRIEQMLTLHSLIETGDAEEGIMKKGILRSGILEKSGEGYKISEEAIINSYQNIENRYKNEIDFDLTIEAQELVVRYEKKYLQLMNKYKKDKLYEMNSGGLLDDDIGNYA